MIFRHISEVKVHVYRQISGQKYEFPAFTGKITHVHTVCTRPFLLLNGPGYEANMLPTMTLYSGITSQLDVCSIISRPSHAFKCFRALHTQLVHSTH